MGPHQGLIAGRTSTNEKGRPAKAALFCVSLAAKDQRE
jgi:hypothetical protein